MNIPYSILFRDEVLIAVNKPSGHLVHPSDAPQEDDLVVMKRLRDQIGMHVNPIHRLDRPTSGVLLFGLNATATKKMCAQFQNGEITKKYLAVVKGIPTEREWECREPVRKQEKALPRDAYTSFKCLYTERHERLGNTLSLIEATPHTGRHHQIRKHLLHQGYPIIGDYFYAGISHSDQHGEALGTGTRMLLQAKSLSFTHPITKEHLIIQAPLDEMIAKCFKELPTL